MNLELFYVTLFFYLLGTGTHCAFIITQRKGTGMWANLFMAFGLAAHTVAIALRYMEVGHTPVANLHESLSFFAWCLVGIYLAVQLRYRVPILGAFISPIALAMVIGASILPKETLHFDEVLRSFWFPIHVCTAFMGDAVFGLAAAAGVMYIIQENQLKSKKVGAWFHRLPSLDVLDQVNHRCIAIGFSLFTAGMITGMAWYQSAYGKYWDWEPRLTWSLVTWLLYAAILHMRLLAGWRGRRAAILSIAGFAIIIASFLGLEHFILEAG